MSRPPLRIELTEAEVRAVLDVIGPVVSDTRAPEDSPLYEAERVIDGALLAREAEGGGEQ